MGCTPHDYLPNITESLQEEFGWGSYKVVAAQFVIMELVNNAFEHGCKGKGDLCIDLALKVQAKGKRLLIN